MPDNIVDLLDQLKRNDERLSRVLFGDPDTGRSGLIDQDRQIQASLASIQRSLTRLWMLYALLVGIQCMTVLQLIWSGMQN